MAETLSVRELFEQNREDLCLSAVTGKLGFDRPVTRKGISRPGLALSGYLRRFHAGSVQVCGSAETAYIRDAKSPAACRKTEAVLAREVPCFMFANGASIPRLFTAAAKKHGVAVFRSSLPTGRLTFGLGTFLNRRFARRTVAHGSLVDVHGVGILLTGKSGIGKSEIALELLERGHRLVADDVVSISTSEEGCLQGMGSELLKHYLELRGIGIVDIRSIFGLRAVRQEKRLEVEVRLEKWNSRRSYERLGMETGVTEHLGVSIPKIVLPVFPGKSIAVILEVVALNYILHRSYGYRPAEKLNERLINLMRQKAEKR